MEAKTAESCPRGAVGEAALHTADAAVAAAEVRAPMVGSRLEELPLDGLHLMCILNEAGAQPGSALLCLLLRKGVCVRDGKSISSALLQLSAMKGVRSQQLCSRGEAQR